MLHPRKHEEEGEGQNVSASQLSYRSLDGLPHMCRIRVLLLKELMYYMKCQFFY